jgi:hypothetical protein
MRQVPQQMQCFCHVMRNAYRARYFIKHYHAPPNYYSNHNLMLIICLIIRGNLT